MKASRFGLAAVFLVGCASEKPANDASSQSAQASPTPTYTAATSPTEPTTSPPPSQPAPTATGTQAATAQPSSTSSPTASTPGTPSTGAGATNKPPTATAQIGKASVSGQVANADAQATGMEKEITMCYAKGLETDQKAGGTVLIALQIGKDGAVTRADTSPSGNVPANVQSCIRQRAEAAKFAAPKGGSAIVTFTVTLAPSTSTAAAGSSTELKEVAVSPPGFEHADKVAQYIRAKARECYRDSLRTDARAEGKVSVALWLDQKGAVTKVEALRTGTLSDGVTQCIRKRAVPAQFPAPKLAPTVVTVPIKLALKK